MGEMAQDYDQEYERDGDELVCVCGAVWAGDELVEAPRKREWVGLSVAEVVELSRRNCFAHEVIRAIEAKLKEKNT